MERMKKNKPVSRHIYTINGDPIALARGRYVNGHVYDSQKTLKLINGITLQGQHGDRPFYEGPLHLVVTFYMSIFPRSKRQYHHHIFRPDLDNMIKWICDVSNTILFADDCIVAKITATKIYDSDPRTEFYLEVLE